MPSCDGMHNLPRQIQGNSLGKKGNFDGEIKEIHLTKNTFPMPPPPLENPPTKPPPPTICLADVMPLAAIRSSAIMEPPVRPTFTPRLDMKLSIFWLTFRNAMAHRNQTKRFPAAALGSGSASLSARTVMGTDRVRIAVLRNMEYFRNFLFMVSSL